MKCPRCQAENREGAQFCRECGIVANTYVGIADFYLGDYRRAVEFHRNVEALHEDLTASASVWQVFRQ